MALNIALDFKWDWKALEQAFFDPTQYVTIDASRGSGKTQGAVNWMNEEMLLSDAIHGLWMDTVNKNIDEYVDIYFSQLLKPIWRLCHWDKKAKKITYPNGHTLRFASAEEPQNAEGFRYHRVVLNEGGLILRNPAIWDNTLEPLTHPKDGIANKTRIVGTMKGKNKFYQLTRMNDPDWKRYHFSIYDCPRDSIEFIEKVKSRIPEFVWRQEYLSEAVDGAGTVFRNIGGCIVPYVTAKKADIMAIDLAKHVDFTVITLLDSRTKQVISQDRFNQIDWVFQKKRIYNTWLNNGKPHVIIDSTGVGDPIYDDLVSIGMKITSFKFTSASKTNLVQSLALAIENQTIKFPAIQPLIAELEIFGFEMSPSGKITYNAPSGMHDDCVISLALANYLLNNKKEYNLVFV